MDIKSRLQSVMSSNRAGDVIDFSLGGGLISASAYADISNALHLLMLVAGLAIICIRLRWYWINRNKKPDDDGNF